MLFSIKNRVGGTMFLTLILAGVSVGLRGLFGLSWDLRFSPAAVAAAAAGLAVIVGVNALLHAAMSACFGETYRSVCRSFVDYFRPQGCPHFIAAGLLAAAEETFFRGVVLEWLMTGAGWNAILSVVASGFLFGLCHVIPDRRFTLFAFWAILEGLFLGGLYAMTHSLTALMLSHFVNDATGYALFAAERRHHWLLGPQKISHSHRWAFFNF